MDKKQIRTDIKTRKSTLTQAGKIEAARKVFERLEASEEFASAVNVLMYHSLPDELSTREFIDRWAGRKNIFLPRVNGENLDILPYDSTRMAPGAFHIEEPRGNDTVDISRIELVVVPAVAYDRTGNRVGRGKGYYDRLLRHSSAIKIGVGYDFQLLDTAIPAEPHDVAVDVVITESYYIKIRRC